METKGMRQGEESPEEWTPDVRTGRAIEILLVEDNPADVRLTEEALREGKVHNRLHVVHDGVDALAFLRREPPFTGVPRPDVVLLDLNLPRMDGRAVLSAVKADPKLRRIPVVVLTTSTAEEDIVGSYNLHANCYITKPVNLQQFMKVVRTVEDFWFEIVCLPPR
jgi:CheY-like chemotaxis protein